MHSLSLPTGCLIPTQEYLTVSKVRELVALDEVAPITLAPYGYGFLFVDGHHRAASRYWRDESVPAIVLDEDEDVFLCNNGVCNGCDLRSIGQLHEFYERMLRPVCLSEGIDSFYDLVARHPIARKERCVTLTF